MEIEAAGAAPTAPPRPAPFSPEVLARELNPAQLEAVLHPARAAAGGGRRRLGQDAGHHLPAGAAGRDGRRPAAHPGGHLHQQGRRRAARAGRQAALGADAGRQPRACGSGRSTPSRRGSCGSGARPSGCARTSSSTTTTIRSACSAGCSPTSRSPSGCSRCGRCCRPSTAPRTRGSTADAVQLGRLLRRRGRQGLQALRGAAGGGQRHRLRRAVDEDAAARAPATRPAAQEIAQRFDHVLVDEFQDTNSVQYRLVRLPVAAAPAASPSSATRTSRSTAGGAPTSATSSTSSATTRAPAW